MEPSASQPPPNPNPVPEPAVPAVPEPAPVSPPQLSRAKLAHILIVAIVIAAVLVAVALAYLLFLNRSAPEDANAAELSTLGSVSFVPPEKLAGYTERSTGLANTKHYVSDDGNCDLLFGVVPAMQLPGKNLDEIIQPQLEQLRQAGAALDGPKDGRALILKDATSTARYGLPTRTYTFSQANKYAGVHYSAAVLQTGERALVSRTCINTDKPVDNGRMDALDAKAKEILVLKQ